MGSGRDSDSYVSSVIKYLMFFFNFLFWLIGAAFIAIGTWAYIEKNDHDYGQPKENKFDLFDLLFDLTVLMIVLGTVIFILAFCGCLGALRENIFLLKFFSYFLAALFTIEVVLAILAFVFSSEIKEDVTDTLKDEAIVRYRDDPDLRNLIDWVQETFECCGVGVNSYKDWSLNSYFNCSESNPSTEKCAVPYSCCLTENDIDENIINSMCGYGAQEMGTIEAAKVIYVDGCVQAMLDFGENNMYIIGAVALGLAIPQLLGILFSLVLIRQVENERSTIPSTFEQ